MKPIIEAAFSLLELLVVLAIFSILSAMAYPKVEEIRDVMNKNSAENQLVQHLRWIQAKSVEQGCRGHFVISSDAKSYSMGCDYIPFNETESSVYDSQMKNYFLPKGITLHVDDKIIFNTRGQSIDVLGALDTKTIELKLKGTAYKTGTIRATGFFDYN